MKNQTIPDKTKVRLKIGDKTYELNAAIAEQTGLLTQIVPPVTKIEPGDYFTFPNGSSSDVVIIQTKWAGFGDPQFVFGGNGVPFTLYSNGPMTKQAMLEMLNRDGAVFVKNLNKF